MKNWKTPVLDVLIVLVATNLTIFYDGEAESPLYWKRIAWSFAILLAIKFGSLVYFAKRK